MQNGQTRYIAIEKKSQATYTQEDWKVVDIAEVQFDVNNNFKDTEFSKMENLRAAYAFYQNAQMAQKVQKALDSHTNQKTESSSGIGYVEADPFTCWIFCEFLCRAFMCIAYLIFACAGGN